MTSSSLATDTAARKRAFRVALAWEEMSAAEFAAQQGVSPQALSQVLTGRDASARLNAAIDDFIRAINKKYRAA